MKTKQTLIALAALAVMTASSAARADSERDTAYGFESSVGTLTRWMTTDSIDPVTSDDTTGFFSLTAGYGMSAPLLGNGLIVVPELVFTQGSLSGRMFSSMDSDLRVTTLVAGARVVRPLFRALSAYGRAGIGLAHGRLSLDGGAGSDMIVRDGDWATTTIAAIGFETRAPTMLEVGIRAEVGYTMTRAFGFDATRDRTGDDEDVLHIPTAAAALGNIDPDGLTIRLAFVFGF